MSTEPRIAIPTGASDLTAQWLTVALATRSGGAPVESVTQQRIGNGMVADSIRLAVTWGGPTDAPVHYVAKVPAAADDSRAAAAATGTYLREAAFYNELAGSVDVHRPTCHLALHDPLTNDYVVLLDDLAPAEAGDQIAGCSVDEAATVIPELVALHAPRWADRSLLDLSWMDRPGVSGSEETKQFVSMLVPGFVDRYSSTVDPSTLELIERFVPRLADYIDDRPEPWTVVHGDFRLDNLLFGGPRVAVLDWQTVRIGPAMSDVAYFIGSALQPGDRASSEEGLVRDYHARMAAAGVRMSWEECWNGYRLSGFDGLLMGILASMLVTRTVRGDEMFTAMVNRHGCQLLDLDAEALIGSR